MQKQANQLYTPYWICYVFKNRRIDLSYLYVVSHLTQGISTFPYKIRGTSEKFKKNLPLLLFLPRTVHFDQTIWNLFRDPDLFRDSLETIFLLYNCFLPYLFQVEKLNVHLPVRGLITPSLPRFPNVIKLSSINALIPSYLAPHLFLLFWYKGSRTEESKTKRPMR